MRQQRFNCPEPLLRCCLLAAALVICLFCPAGFAVAQPVAATGDKTDIWLMRKTGIDDLTVYHRSAGDPPGQLISVAKIEGRLYLRSTASGPGMLWIVKEQDGWVESLAVDNNPLPSLPRYSNFKLEQRLPAGVRPVAGAAGANGLWLLVSIDNQAKLKEFNAAMAPASARTGTSGFDMMIPPRLAMRGITSQSLNPQTQPVQTQPVQTQPAQSQPAQTQPAQASPAKAPADPSDKPVDTQDQTGGSTGDIQAEPTFPIYRVLHLYGSVWRDYAGPQVSGRQEPFAMLFMREGQASPVIFSQSSETGITRWVFEDGKWNPGQIKSSSGFDRAIVVDHQPVFARFTKPSSLWLGVLSGEEIVALPSVELQGDAAGGWAVVPVENTIGVLQQANGKNDGAEWSLELQRIDLMGQPQQPAIEELRARPLNFWYDSPNLVFFAGSLFIGLLLMWSLWARDNVESAVRLPQGVVKADIPRRVFACLFDLVPCIWIAMLIYKVEFGELIRQLFELNKSWHLLRPWLFCVVLLAVYSAVCEAFYGRTLGKLLVGIRVSKLDGTPPGALQVLIRNVVKIIEVLCFPLMFIPIARLNAQRLGDMAARTIVVTDEPEQDPADDDEEM